VNVQNQVVVSRRKEPGQQLEEQLDVLA